jgi:hypothetical protein
LGISDWVMDTRWCALVGSGGMGKVGSWGSQCRAARGSNWAQGLGHRLRIVQCAVCVGSCLWAVLLCLSFDLLLPW